jgi:hypothetical protein
MLTNTIGMRLRNLEASDLPKDDEILSNLIIRLKKCLEDDKRRPQNSILKCNILFFRS